VSGMLLSVALVFASQTLLSPCGTFIFVANSLCAKYMNHESFRWTRDGLCIFGIVVGVVICVIVAPKEDSSYDADQLIELYQGTSFIVFMIFWVLTTSGLYITRWKILKDHGGDITNVTDRTKLTILNLVYGAFPGLLGGMNITLTKTIFTVIGGQYSDHGGIVGVVTSPLPYILGISVGTCYVWQLRAMTNALDACCAMVIICTESVVEEMIATLGGLFYFQDYKNFKAWQLGVFALGMIIAVCAAASLTILRMREDGTKLFVGGESLLPADDESDGDVKLENKQDVEENILSGQSP